MIHVAAPQRVRHRLSRAADGPLPVVHRGRHALYADLDGELVGLVSARASRVPCALWSRQPDLGALADADVQVWAGELVVGDQVVRTGRLVDTTLPRPRPSSATLDALRSPARTPPMTPARAVGLLGRGPGLTPYGDDVLSGWLAVRAAARRPDRAVLQAVAGALGRTTTLSATLLRCAARGEAVPELAAWLRGVGTPARVDAERALLGVGASSGAGLLAGAREALLSLSDKLPDEPALRRTA